MKTKNSVVGYVHKNVVHLHQSILKENINLTMQLLIFESKAKKKKKLKCATEDLPDFPLFFFQKANQIITLLIFVTKIFLIL